MKQGIKSEKLEAAKTEAKAAFVAKVGSISGAGKLKEFEHRNEELQERIQELKKRSTITRRTIQHKK